MNPDTETDYDYLFKLCTVGDRGVGKTCLINTISTNTFQEAPHPFAGIEFRTNRVTLTDLNNISQRVKCELWDLGRSDRQFPLPAFYFRGASVVIIDSFRGLRDWISDVRLRAAENAVIAVVACKIDVEETRLVCREEALEFAASEGLKYFECSSKKVEGVREIFASLMQAVLLQRQAEDIPSLRHVAPKDIHRTVGWASNGRNCVIS